MKRTERLSQEKDEKLAANQSRQIAQEKLQEQADLLATQSQISLKEQELEDLKSAPTLSVPNIVKCQDELEGLRKGEKAIKALQKELY